MNKVKKYESAVVGDPITIEPEAKLSAAVALMRENGISGIPVTRQGKLVGILTNRDLRFERNLEQTVEAGDDHATWSRRARGSPSRRPRSCSTATASRSCWWSNEAFELRGLITIKDIEKIQKHPNAAKDRLGRLLCGAAVGVGADREARIAALLKAGADVIVIDTAHGHSPGVIEAVRDTKAQLQGHRAGGRQRGHRRGRPTRSAGPASTP